ncbi:hypothetical protein J3454_06115 [Erythrobacter sp. NFXS35]|uniref:hypothetical protein n=1 Tax=Erythrobacter sp. NFXS35 TaxID=2818436 RepID=UPI0032E015D4
MVRRRISTKRTDAEKSGESRLPSPDPATNLMIADVVLRGANLLLRKRLEKGLLTGQIGSDNAKRLVENRGVMSTVALWGASRLATRSPVGLAVVAGGLAAKVLYDRGKRVQSKRRARKTTGTTPDAES